VWWKWCILFEWSHFAIFVRPWWRWCFRLYAPEEDRNEGVLGSPERKTTACFVYVGPLTFLFESGRPAWSSAMLPWGASW
jgi:hypothetical protein